MGRDEICKHLAHYTLTATKSSVKTLFSLHDLTTKMLTSKCK